jgi:predicted neuraminidase
MSTTTAAESQMALPYSTIPSPCVQNHAANLMPLGDGSLGCVWFGGTQEGMSDISVYFSRLPSGAAAWSEAVKLSDDASRSEQNPILFYVPDGALWLIWTAQFSGNQDTAFVRRRISHDHGRSWGPIETLFPQTPGKGLFVRQPITVLANGDWLLPVFYCHTVAGEKWSGDQDTSGVKFSSDQGKTWRDIEVPDSVGCVHMCINLLSGGRLFALYRSRWADHIYQSHSSDGGKTWTAPVPTALPNNNSSIQATRLANGHLALVFNYASAAQATDRRLSLYDEIEDETPITTTAQGLAPTSRKAFWGAPRAPMSIAISQDDGKTWAWRHIETGDGYCMTNNSRERTNRELSYPSVKQTPDGKIHVAYTHFRQTIRHVCLDEAWVLAAPQN